ncbi:MAG: Lrp/AsnC ligand binding domain-containing protein [Deltaproteobacteria bacterium]|nr:Lrp/AsnC ligand binding domain-containing protein [Deltaproteobacteria bacterium]
MTSFVKKIFSWADTADDGNIKSFVDNQKQEQAFDERHLGIQAVPISQIVGSVGRYQDFNRKFRLKKDRPSVRFERVKQAFDQKITLPPIVLYQIKDEYYVLDGNHRVAVAKKMGYEFIDAEITEFLPSKNTLENLIYREKVSFFAVTELPKTIELTEVGQYDRLLKQIEEHHVFLRKTSDDKIDYLVAAMDWYKTIYSPLVTIIKNSRLNRHFSKRTRSDLYVYISNHQWVKGKEREYGIGIDQLIPKNMEEFRSKMSKMKELVYAEIPEMKHWISAFILIDTKVGKERDVMRRLYAMEEIQEVHNVHGVFDLIAKIMMKRDLLASDAEIIGQFLNGKVRQVKDVTKTQTLIPISSKEKKPILGRSS